MTGKISTISARFSQEQVDALERLQRDLGLSKTDVLQFAVEHLSTRKVIKGENRIEIAISGDALKRAARLHDFYGYGVSVEDILSKAVELGLKEIRKEIKENRLEDAELGRLDIETRSIEMQQDSITN